MDSEIVRGCEYFDDEDVWKSFLAVRERSDTPRAQLELPEVLAFMGPLEGRSVLDLGCGDAWLGKYVLARGARRYVGVDGSENMVKAARENLSGTSGEVQRADLETWIGLGIGHVDTVVSRLVFSQIEYTGRLMSVVKHVMSPTGAFVFSVEHPVMTASQHEDSDGLRIRDYFREGERAGPWAGFRGWNEDPERRHAHGLVRKYHRSLQTYFRYLREAGFVVEVFSEGRSEQERRPKGGGGHLEDAPLFAVFRCIPQ